MSSILGVRIPGLGGASDRTTALKWFSLLLLIFQSSTHALLIRYSKTLGASSYLPSSTVVVCEVIKFAVSLAMVLMYEVPPTTAAASASQVSWSTRVSYAQSLLLDSLHSIVPAFIYAVQNNLVFIALANLDAATFQVMYQSKIITTALFSVSILNKRLSITQWIALVLLVLGVVLVQNPSCEQQALQRAGAEAADIAAISQHRNLFLGLVVVITISLTSGFAGVYFEKIVKSSKTLSVFARNMQLALWGFVFSVIGMLYNDWDALAEGGLFQGYNATVWSIINVSAFGGLLIAVVVKYTDNIAKGFATSISILVSTVFSATFFDFSVDVIFFVGASVVIISVFLYSEPEKIYGQQQPAASITKATGSPLQGSLSIPASIGGATNSFGVDQATSGTPGSPGLPIYNNMSQLHHHNYNGGGSPSQNAAADLLPRSKLNLSSNIR